MEDAHQSLYQRLLREATGRNPADPVLRFYVERGVQDMGSAMRFHFLKRKNPRAYERLLEERRQAKLF
jgi:hypothetical protein